MPTNTPDSTHKATRRVFGKTPGKPFEERGATSPVGGAAERPTGERRTLADSITKAISDARRKAGKNRKKK